MNLPDIRLVNDRIAVMRQNNPGKTEGGIIIPESAKEKIKKGVIVAVGPGRFYGDIYASRFPATPKDSPNGFPGRAPMQVSVGDVIEYDALAERKIDVNGDEVIIIYEVDVMAVIGRDHQVIEAYRCKKSKQSSEAYRGEEEEHQTRMERVRRRPTDAPAHAAE